MKPKHYAILSDCIEEGCRYGVMRAHKYTENPSHEVIKDAVHSAIMERINQYYDFPEAELLHSSSQPSYRH
jgi:hypothetical protein